MKTVAFVFFLLAAAALTSASPYHVYNVKAPQEAVAKPASLLPPKPTHKPPKPTHKPTTTTTTTTTTTEAATTTTEEAIPTLPPTIGDYSLVGNFGYYKLIKKYTSWADAWEECILDDAHLLVIRSEEEFLALYRWKPSEMPPFVHYGAHHRYANHKFVTIFDEPLDTVGYNDFGWDYSNKTYFNNKDFPLVIIDLSISVGSSGLYLSSERQSDYEYYICKKDIP